MNQRKSIPILFEKIRIFLRRRVCESLSSAEPTEGPKNKNRVKDGEGQNDSKGGSSVQNKPVDPGSLTTSNRLISWFGEPIHSKGIIGDTLEASRIFRRI